MRHPHNPKFSTFQCYRKCTGISGHGNKQHGQPYQESWAALLPSSSTAQCWRFYLITHKQHQFNASLWKSRASSSSLSELDQSLKMWEWLLKWTATQEVILCVNQHTSNAVTEGTPMKLNLSPKVWPNSWIFRVYGYDIYIGSLPHIIKDGERWLFKTLWTLFNFILFNYNALLHCVHIMLFFSSLASRKVGSPFVNRITLLHLAFFLGTLKSIEIQTYWQDNVFFK